MFTCKSGRLWHLSIPNYFGGIKQLQNLYLQRIWIFVEDKHQLDWISLENVQHRLFHQFFQYVEVAWNNTIAFREMIFPFFKDKKNESSLKTIFTLPQLKRTLFVNVLDIEVHLGEKVHCFKLLLNINSFFISIYVRFLSNIDFFIEILLFDNCSFPMSVCFDVYHLTSQTTFLGHFKISYSIKYLHRTEKR